MARKKNASFVPTTPFDVDVDALTLKHTIENAIGNTALVYDMLTGENGEANTIRHIGGGRGCPLGVPLWQQNIGRGINYRGTGSVKGGVPGPVWLLAHPFFLPEGETTFRVCLRASGPFAALSPAVRVTTTGGTTEFGPVSLIPSEPDADGEASYECSIDGLTTGLHLVFLEVNTDGSSTANIDLLSWHGYFWRRRPETSSPARRDSGVVVSVTTPTATQGVAHVSFQDTTFSNDAAIDSYQTTYLDRNLNGLEEYGSGWPAGENASYTHEDHDGAGVLDLIDPARSRFHACTRSLYASEPELDFPWVAGAAGAYGIDGLPVIDPGAAAPTAGMLSWFAPYPLTASLLTMLKVPGRAPDFQTGSSRLKWAVLAATDLGAGATAWRATVDLSVASTSAFGAAFAAGPSVSCLTLATGTGLGGWSGDLMHTISIKSDKTTAFAATYTEFFLLGYCLYWEP